MLFRFRILAQALALMAVLSFQNPLLAEEGEFVGAFKEMMPEVSYTADRETRMTMGSTEQVMNSRIVYAPYREWAATTIEGMGATEVVTITDHLVGKEVTSVMGVNTASRIEPMQSLADGGNGASIELMGKSNMNGVPITAYNFTMTQTQDGVTYRSRGRVLLDDDGIPRVIFWTIESDQYDTIKLMQQLSNVVVGPVDETLFAALDTPVNQGPSDPMAAMMAAAGAGAPAIKPPAPTNLQATSIGGQLRDWPGGQGRILDGSGNVIGMINDSGRLSISASQAPSGGIYPMASGYTCDGATLSDPQAGSAILENFEVVDSASRPIGIIYGASSMDTVMWWANPAVNDAAPGYTLRLVYVDRPVQSSGYCANGSETQERQLDFKPGWNIEKHEILAVGDSPFFESRQPTQTSWRTIGSVPADAVWVFANMTPTESQARQRQGGLPDPLQEVVDTAKDTAVDETKQEVADKVRKGIRSLFR